MVKCMHYVYHERCDTGGMTLEIDHISRFAKPSQA
jgi:hypothetical protein